MTNGIEPPAPPDPSLTLGMTQRVRLTRRDWVFIAVCAAVALVSLLIITRFFSSTFPEASIEFRYDRATSRQIAERLLSEQKLDIRAMKHAAIFDADDTSRIFLERSLGLKRTNEILKREVRVWYWHHRWFRPLQEEEYSVDIAPTGELVSFTRKLPESRAMPAMDAAPARAAAEAFLNRNRVPIADLTLVAQSERALPKRIQRIFTWESRSIRPAGAPYRHIVTIDGDSVSSYGQQLKVPDHWLRSYAELRSKNELAGRVDTVFLIATMIAAVVVFVVRLRRGDMSVRFLLTIGAITAILVGGVAANTLPLALIGYDTTTSYAAFLASITFRAIIGSLGAAMLLIVICGAGEVLYRERLPQHLAIPKLWTRRALTSKRVFDSLILGYALVLFFICYQVVFYLVAEKFGAWSPAEVPYDNMLNTAIPWVAVLFAGFFPSFSEEFLSRAFSIPFFERVMRSRIFAIVFAGFLWGFGHATYPNQPFYIRGLEVGVAGVLLGFLMYRFGLLSLLIWHYTVDAVYTALLLLRSGNNYYIFSGSFAALVFAIPLVVSIAWYIRNRGFIPDDDLTNATMPVLPPSEAPAAAPDVSLPPPIAVTPARIAIAGAAAALAVIVIIWSPPSIDDVINYRIDNGRAKQIGAAHLRSYRQPLPQKVAAAPVSGFRNWEPQSPREEGGSPNGFDDVAATYMLRNGSSINNLIEIMRTRIQAATYTVRFFTPMEKTEYFVEVDPRTARAIGYHKYADEQASGPRLERDAALAIASRAFSTYGESVSSFEVKEALAFQQPNRRDWLFHFDERTPIVAQAYRRVTVRVMGNEVTQFATTVKVPDEVYREFYRQTLANVILTILRIVGMILGLALVVTGLIVSTRQSGFPWRRSLRLTVLLAIIPIAGALVRYESYLFRYDTSVAWNTFLAGLFTGLFTTAGLQILLIFVAIAGIYTVFPHAFALASREGVARFGRDAALGAVTAISVYVVGRALMQLLVLQFPSMAAIHEISIPDSIAVPLPSLFELLESIFDALMLSGAVALFVAAVRSWPKKWAAPVLTMAIVFCVSLNSRVSDREIALMVLTRIMLAVLVWVIARYILDGNILAWPVAAFTASLLQSATALAQNDRVDLRVHAAILFLIAVATLVALGSGRRQPVVSDDAWTSA
jgi:membrane protease YdiL (CAAX protease family)